jgi:uncharacterized protein (DUF427 family)
MKNIIKEKQRKEIYEYVESHKIVPSDFDNNNKVRLYVYSSIVYYTSTNYNKNINLFIDSDYYFNDFVSECFINVLPQLKGACQYYIDRGRDFVVPAILQKIKWVLATEVKKYMVRNTHKYGRSSMYSGYIPLEVTNDDGVETILFEDTAFLPGDIYTDMVMHHQQKYVVPICKRKVRNKTSKYKVYLEAKHRPVYFNELADVADFFGMTKTHTARYIAGSRYYDLMSQAKKSSVRMIKKIEVL